MARICAGRVEQLENRLARLSLAGLWQRRNKRQIKYPHENLIFLDSSFLLKWSVAAKKEKEAPHACFG